MRPWWTVGAVGAIVVAVGLVFANTLDNGFHMDDAVRIQSNAEIRRVLPLGRHFRDPATLTSFQQLTAFRPLMPLTLSFDVAIGGDAPASFRRTNLLLHALSGVLAYGLVRELLAAAAVAGGPVIALLVALAWAVHPVSGVVVNYLSARDLALMQAFMLASLLLYVRMRRRGGPPSLWGPILLCALLSLLGKMNVALPAVVWVLELGLLDRQAGPWKAALRALPFAAVVVLVFAYVRLVLGFSELANVADAAVGPLGYAADQLRLHGAHYLWHFVWPWSMALFPDLAPGSPWTDVRLALGVVALAGLVAVAVVCRRTQPLVTTGVLAYLVLMLPESSVLPLSHAHMPYRPYPGMLFLFLAAASAATTWGGARLATGLTALFVVASALASVELNPIWRTSETLFTHAVAHGGGLQAHLNLAAAYPDRMDPRILAHLEQAMRLAPPSDTQTRFKLGIQLVQTRADVERGLALLRTVAEQRPDYSLYPFGLGEALAFVGRPQEGLPYIERAIADAPTLVAYRLRAAAVNLQMGRIDAARAHLDAVARVDPGNPGLAELRAHVAGR